MTLTKLKNPCYAKEYKAISRKIAYLKHRVLQKYKVETLKTKVIIECREFELKELIKQREDMKA